MSRYSSAFVVERSEFMAVEKKVSYAKIVTFSEFSAIRPTLGKIVCTSGGYDPIHPGHISCLVESCKYGDVLVVIVNGDSFLRAKKGKPFQDIATRCDIVSSIIGVDYVIPFEIEDDMTVSVALAQIKPAVFTKGGDRSSRDNIPEWSVCQELGIEVVFGVGREKKWSSSSFLDNWKK